MEIVPAIDLIDGKCVRLSQGDYGRRKVYSDSPLEVAKSFEAAGIRRLHLVDLDGAKAQHIVHHRILEQITSHTSLIVDFGGGLKTDEDLRIAFESGAQMVTGGSIAVKSPEAFENWINTYGPERIILGADVSEGKIAVSGWTERSELDLWSFLENYVQKGINKVICTDISRDGMLRGPALELYTQILAKYPELHLIASGGVSSLKDLDDLKAAGLPAAILGKAIYEGRIQLKDLSKYIC
ncbi:MAG: 1-(5-phosphoribosyl)-5-[(5-phosphoribosylamino)methylideneamino]imidazole-4-carboxamide isomerase [Bacteroidales bacterium]|jgi:phosphoribosylformimino-5-aminoimidazole carboxamide ribotide isomerase|nr:1-(5-phosphoribosyl)-5-[(5-phosphoribosylamino)methylideneamino]imidazole-4-carboxamide isomerase [Bacteroidota bacterium]HNZ80337.1 1-(5-phosphoribosyl)-5-[(5-phosphoribosylamino)methylideneamino]imidazole-4-carboxamide isomerase [Bacteroidales bacterium]HPY59007.1 1-(5-phosphoribosyl)-5-[(5-phosphoribosylamino)methylideneamino]imidazole-4-carboxamide isomerase [Bacteroidales bacterium]HQB71442.1 1-(5-phosphoribosyl)-5-[(5-phosphoribosylamino)methylideneamino]imidazole-4-carboxamide isomeras